MEKVLSHEVRNLALLITKELHEDPKAVSADMLMALRGCAQILDKEEYLEICKLAKATTESEAKPIEKVLSREVRNLAILVTKELQKDIKSVTTDMLITLRSCAEILERGGAGRL